MDNRKLLFYIRRQKGHAFRLSCNSIYTNKASQESYYRFCRLFSPGIEDMGASDEVIGKYAISKNDSKNIQAQMLMDLKSLPDLAISFLSLTWILCINQTKKKLYTSDSPIGTHAHVDHPIMSMNGLKSKGVEVFFPISPECILVMFDGSYHFQNAHLERRYVLLDNEAYIDYYNSLCAMQSERCVFSSDGDFALLKK